MTEHDEPSSTDPAEIEAVIARLKQSNLADSDTRLIERLLRLLLMLTRLVEQKNFSISRLKRLLFGPRSDRRLAPKKGVPESKETSAPEAAQAPEQAPPATEPKSQRKGHGRLAAADYPGASVVHCEQETQLAVGAACPHSACAGHLYDTRQPAIFIRLTGQPLIAATRYEQEVLRCSACAARFTAPLPSGVSSEKYDATCDVALALAKYGMGLPWYRVARQQQLCGVPVPETVQFERCEVVADALFPVYREMMREAARSGLIYVDDTGVKILSCARENQRLPPRSKQRRETQTTGVVADLGGGRRAALYFSGRRHAGENIAELLAGRPPEFGPPIQMSDALSRNWTGALERVCAKCWAHARREFIELEASWPAECARVLETIQQLYENDKKTQGMSGAARLRFHQERSGPVLDELWTWVEAQFSTKQVEPNSRLGQALRYLENHRVGLTEFLRTENVPLDNNAAERVLKRAVLLRKNALFYKTEHGAAISDILLSVIESCRLNKANVWEYLLAIMQNQRAVQKASAHWTPWQWAERARAPTVAAA